MSNPATVIVKDVEVVAEKVLSFLGKAGADIAKVQSVEPAVVAALGTILGSVAAVVTAGAADAAAPSVPLTAEVIADLKAVWPQVVSFAATLGIKL